MKQSNSISSLPIRSIRTDHTIQQRAKLLDNGIVAEYSEAMQAGCQFPPVIVYYDGANHWLADGYHRLEAADEAGKKTIAAGSVKAPNGTRPSTPAGRIGTTG